MRRNESDSTAFPTDEARWAALERRDPAADGRFVYSVRTTGVYCRPTCGARRPRRENVRFHEACSDAERAGFRPCRRCRPRDASPETRPAAAVAEACRFIEESPGIPSMKALAERARMSGSHFTRIFEKATGLTPRAYAAGIRARRAREEVKRAPTVTAAIHRAGYGSSGRFYEAAPHELGMTPTQLRAGGSGVRIRFAVGECSLGSVLVAASAKGICAVFLGDDPGELVRELEDRFPTADLIGADAGFEDWVSRVVALVESPAAGLDLPLDIRGTAFQEKVWRTLLEIPIGSTASYTEIARRVGAPRSVRAVAGACAANPVAIAIPCHRVVKQDGSLSGYRWGVDRKRALLRREGALPPLTGGGARKPRR